MTSRSDLEALKRPLTVIAGPYGHPFHPILVTMPIGAWVSSLVFASASRFAAEPDPFTIGGRWLVVLGIVGALAAAAVGFIDLVALPSSTKVRRAAWTHASLNLVVVAAFIGVWLLYPQTGQVSVSAIALSALALGVLGVSGWLGGKLAYRYGVRVAFEVDQQDGLEREA